MTEDSDIIIDGSTDLSMPDPDKILTEGAIQVSPLPLEEFWFHVTDPAGNILLNLTMKGVVETCGRKFDSWEDFWLWLGEKLVEIEALEGSKDD